MYKICPASLSEVCQRELTVDDHLFVINKMVRVADVHVLFSWEVFVNTAFPLGFT